MAKIVFSQDVCPSIQDEGLVRNLHILRILKVPAVLVNVPQFTGKGSKFPKIIRDRGRRGGNLWKFMEEWLQCEENRGNYLTSLK